jgi:hypothetical protein
MKKVVQNNLTWIINKLSEEYVYKWNDNNKENFERFYEELKKNIDLTKLTREEARELRFGKWSEEQPDLYLFPLWLVPIIPEGLDVVDICGNRYKYEKETADNDIRFGCVPYGIEIKE